ncbi:hypothetical protein [Streptomyces sp. NPDC101249]|uniref:hypothetical protein n=1 Tax=Streptomyces sp. NPDC101249 TaxID=3366140 RepID=UPI0037F29101
MSKPEIHTVPEFVRAIREIAALAVPDGRERVYDLLGGILGFAEREALRRILLEPPGAAE